MFKHLLIRFYDEEHRHSVFFTVWGGGGWFTRRNDIRYSHRLFGEKNEKPIFLL